MRNLVSAIIAVSLVSTSAFAGAALAPGKPAGVQKAQGSGVGTEWLVFGGIAGLAAGVLIATSGGRASEAQNQNVVTQATSTT
jgi:hypothetical protein